MFELLTFFCAILYGPWSLFQSITGLQGIYIFIIAFMAMHVAYCFLFWKGVIWTQPYSDLARWPCVISKSNCIYFPYFVITLPWNEPWAHFGLFLFLSHNFCWDFQSVCPFSLKAIKRIALPLFIFFPILFSSSRFSNSCRFFLGL